MLWHLFALNPDQMTALERMLLRVALCVVLCVAVRTYVDNRTYSGDDLRNRVVGARVMLAGYDPYTFFWMPGMPEELLDPVHEPKAHRLTISPPTLLFYAIGAPLPFKTLRFISFILEWLAMIASLVLLARSLPEQRQRVVFLLGATLFVLATDIWRLHLERGQVYVFQLLALSAAIAWSRRGQVDSIAAGIALGVLALMRPNLLVIAPALLLIRQWRSSGAMLATVGVGIAVAFLMLPTSSWQSYLDVGDQYYRAVDDPDMGPDDFPAPAHTGPVEGVQSGNSLTNLSCSSFAHLYYVLRTRFSLPRLDIGLTSKIILACLAALLLALVWRRRGGDVQAAFALIVVMSLDTEFFLPHRWGYVDVMLLAPLALMLPALLQHQRLSLQAFGLVLLGLVSALVGPHFLDIHTTTVLRSWLVMGALTALVISSPSGRRSESGSD
jgi:hypothetical protein